MRVYGCGVYVCARVRYKTRRGFGLVWLVVEGRLGLRETAGCC